MDKLRSPERPGIDQQKEAPDFSQVIQDIDLDQKEQEQTHDLPGSPSPEASGNTPEIRDLSGVSTKNLTESEAIDQINMLMEKAEDPAETIRKLDEIRKKIT
jgi:hypothetical protein